MRLSFGDNGFLGSSPYSLFYMEKNINFWMTYTVLIPFISMLES